MLGLALSIPVQQFFSQHDAYNYPSELWLVGGFYALAALMISVFYHLVLNHPASRLVAGLAAVYALTNDFDVRSTANPGFLLIIIPHAERLLAFAVLVAAAFGLGLLVEWAGRRWLWWRQHTLAVMVRLLVAGIVLTNAVSLTNYLQHLSRPLSFQPQALTAPADIKPASNRDVYYIVFDRYANNATLSKHYNYDNSAMTDFLRTNGFTVRDAAYSNYQFTSLSISSTMRMDYHSDIQADLGDSKFLSYLPYRAMLEDSPVSRFFAAAGYDVTRLPSWYGVTREEANGEVIDPQFEMTLFGHTFLLSDLQSMILEHTFFASWLRQGIQLGPLTIGHINAHDMSQLVLDQLSDLREVANKPHDQPQFVFAHILSPHPPFEFLPDGSTPSYNIDDNNGGAPRDLKYTNQLQFLNGQIQTTIASIKASSKTEPIIILQADEGPYPPEFADYAGSEDGGYPWNKASADTLRYKYGILAAYNLPGLTDEEKAELNSPVNAFRFVFDHYFTGANLPLLPDCSLLFNGDRPNAFFDVTAKIRGTAADPACAAYASRGSLE